MGGWDGRMGGEDGMGGNDMKEILLSQEGLPWWGIKKADTSDEIDGVEKVTLDVNVSDEENPVLSQYESPGLGIEKTDIDGVEKVTLDVNAWDEGNPVKEILLSQEELPWLLIKKP